MKRKLKKILQVFNSLLYVFFICFMVYMLITSYSTMKLSQILQLLCIFPLIMVPYVLDKIKGYQIDEKLIFFYYLFLLFALVMGSILKVFYQIWWFDLFTHFLSGILTSIFAYIILEKYQLTSYQYRFFALLFILAFTVFVAGCWEYFEFTCDKLFSSDVQWVAKTGVDDTMTDMLIATLGGILSSIYYYIQIRNKK